MKMFYQFLLIGVLSILFLTACDPDDEENVVPVYLEDFTEYTSSKSLESADIKDFLMEKGQTEFASLVNHDIKIYKLTYRTAFEGDSVLASGLVAVPVPANKKESFPVMSYQHGVVISNNDAPSVNPLHEINEMATYVAATGFIVAIPDYIGFGSTEGHFHPFMHKEYTVNAVLDFIRATKELVASEKLCKTSKNLFLAGYGQGAGATLASLYAIENDSVKNADLKVKASTCTSGIYNLTEFREWLVSQTKFDQPWYFVYMLESFKRYAGLELDYSYIFNEPFAAMLPGMIDGTKTGDQMNNMLGTKHVGELLNNNFEFNENYNTDSVYAGIRDIFIQNSVPAWPLKSNLSIYYGKDDAWIPAEQSLYIFNDFKDLGLTTNIRIEALNGLNHETAVIPSLVKSVRWFKSL